VASGHGHLTLPIPRHSDGPTSWAPDKGGGWPQASTYAFENFRPAFAAGHRFSWSAFRCKDYAAAAPLSTIEAGSLLEVAWWFQPTANHPGDCSLYISYDRDKHEPANWIKLQDFVGCGSDWWDPASSNMPPAGTNSYAVRLPKWLPSCEHCVLRWEWTAVHNRPNVQQYVDCADVVVKGTSMPHADFLRAVTPITRISGAEHLRGNGYVRSYYCCPCSQNHCWDGCACEIGLEYMHGPAVATFAAQQSPTQQPSPLPPALHMPPPSLPPVFSDSQCDRAAGQCCVVLFAGEPGTQCESPMPVWDFEGWVHPGGSFVFADTLCGSVRYRWASKGLHGKQGVDLLNDTSLPGGALKIGEAYDPLCLLRASTPTLPQMQPSQPPPLQPSTPTPPLSPPLDPLPPMAPAPLLLPGLPCKDRLKRKKCRRKKRKQKCRKAKIRQKCAATCHACQYAVAEG